MKVFFLCMSLLFLCTTTRAVALDAVYCDAQQCDRDPKHLEQFMEQFYIWYIISSYEDQIPWWEEPVKSKLQRAISPTLYSHLRHVADKTGYNPILYAQDYTAEWLHPHIALVNLENDSARLKVSFISEHWPVHSLDVRLKVIGNIWRIDEIHLIPKDDK